MIKRWNMFILPNGAWECLGIKVPENNAEKKLWKIREPTRKLMKYLYAMSQLNATL